MFHTLGESPPCFLWLGSATSSRSKLAGQCLDEPAVFGEAVCHCVPAGCSSVFLTAAVPLEGPKLGRLVPLVERKVPSLLSHGSAALPEDACCFGLEGWALHATNDASTNRLFVSGRLDLRHVSWRLARMSLPHRNRWVSDLMSHLMSIIMMR